MTDLVPVKRALISVSDKTGLADFAKALVNEFHVTLLSTGGTAKFLRDAGLPVTDVADVTGFPEMMDGRVKTLHPKIHGGLLALRDNPQHVASAKAHNIEFIDLVVINLYPFAQTIANPNVTLDHAIENIDIGGPSMVRSAAKNNAFVTVVTSPSQYEKVLGDLRQHAGSTCSRHRLKLAQAAFDHTATYDRTIADYLSTQIPPKPSTQQTGGSPARFIADPKAGRIALATDELPDPTPTATTRQQSRLIDRLRKSQSKLPQFLHDLLMAQAVQVSGTEAACFFIDPQRQGSPLQVVDHIRPDHSTPEIREQAIRAFQEIVNPCVQQNSDGAIAVGGDRPTDDGTQFCLVTLLRTDGRPFAVTAVITRCVDDHEARRRLAKMQFLADYTQLLPVNAPATPEQPVTSTLPDHLPLSLTKKQNLRYGENPHQRGALYTDTQHSALSTQHSPEASVARATQHHGKELSYINLLDADAAMSAVKEFTTPAACIVKHATPCGLATAPDLPTAFNNAYAGDPLAAFGGIVALNRPVDLPTAQSITEGQKFLEVILAPSYSPDALDLLKSRWKNVRLLEVPGTWQLLTRNSELGTRNPELMMHKIAGGYLVQDRDTTGLNVSDWKVVSTRQPTEAELADLKLAWLACKHVKSNAIVLAKDQMMLGSGAGQQDRVNACRIAIAKAGDRSKNSVAASDAFFPFPDGPTLLLDSGVTAIIHPGGSVRDHETLSLVNSRNAALILTGQRHFKH